MNFEERCNEMVNVVNNNIKCSASEIRSIIAREFLLLDRDVSAVFNLITGEDLNKCIINYKLLGIQKMKLETGCTWDMASKAYGYDEYVTFYRNFTKRIGMSPDELFESGIMFEPDAIGKVANHINNDEDVDLDGFLEYQEVLINRICTDTKLPKERVLEDLDVYLSKFISLAEGIHYNEISFSDEMKSEDKEKLDQLYEHFENENLSIPISRAKITSDYIYFNYGRSYVRPECFGDFYSYCCYFDNDETIDNYLAYLGFKVFDNSPTVKGRDSYYKFRSKPTYPALAFVAKYADKVRINFTGKGRFRSYYEWITANIKPGSF